MLARDRVSGEEVAIKFLNCGSNGRLLYETGSGAEDEGPT